MLKRLAVLLVIFIGAAGIAGVAFLNHLRFEKAITDLVRQQMLIIAHIDAGSIQNSISDIEKELEFLSRQFLSQENVLTGLNIFEESYRQIDKYVAFLELIDANGNLLNRWPSEEDSLGEGGRLASDVKTMIDNPHVHFSSVFDLNEDEKAVAFLLPVLKGGRFVAFFRAIIPLAKLNEWAGYVQQRKDEYSLILNSQGQILDYVRKNYIGKNIISAIEEIHPGYDISQITGIMDAGARGEEGTKVMQFLSGREENRLVKTVLAFAPINVGPKPWYIIVAMRYNLIGWPITRNALDNLFFMLLIMIVVFVFLKLRARLFKDGIALTASNIIIKLLRSDNSVGNSSGGSSRSPNKHSSGK